MSTWLGKLNLRDFAFILLVTCIYVGLAFGNIYFIDRIDVYGVSENNNGNTADDFGFFLDDKKVNILGKSISKYSKQENCEFGVTLDSLYLSNNGSFTVDNERGLLCVSGNGNSILHKRIFSMNRWQAALNKIKKLFVGGASRIFVVVPTSGKVAVFQNNDKSGAFSVDLKQLEVMSHGRLLYFCIGVFITIITASLICLLWPSIHSFFRGKTTLIVSMAIPVVLGYVALFPGIFCMDLITNHSYNASTLNIYSTVYSLLMNLFSTIDYTSVIIVSCLLFLFSFLIHAAYAANSSVVMQVFLALPIYAFLCLPAFTISIFGLQRIPFTNIVFLSFLSMITLFCIRKNVDAFCVSLLLFSLLCLLRVEYLFFIVPLAYCSSKEYCLLKKYTLKLMCVFLFCVIFVSSVLYIESRNENTRNYKYMSIMLHAYVTPYITQATQLHRYFLTGGIHNEYHNEITLSGYKQCLQFFINNLQSNPYPYVNAAFSRYFSAMLRKETWGHSLDKFKLLEQGRSWHHELAFHFFVTRLEICPFGQSIYSLLTEYIQYNQPFMKNGILVASLLILFIFPFIFRSCLQMLLLNYAMIAKFIFTILFSPAGYALYYYDIVIYSGFMLYIIYLRLIDERSKGRH